MKRRAENAILRTVRSAADAQGSEDRPLLRSGTVVPDRTFLSCVRAEKMAARPAFAVKKQHRGRKETRAARPAFAVAKQRREREKKQVAHPAFAMAKQRRGRKEKKRADAFSPSAGRFRAALLPGKRHGRDEKTEEKRLFFQKCAIIFSKTLDFRKNYAIIVKDRIDEYEEWLASHSSFHVRAHDAPPLYAKTEFPRRRIHEKRNQRHRA